MATTLEDLERRIKVLEHDMKVVRALIDEFPSHVHAKLEEDVKKLKEAVALITSGK